MRLKRDIHLRFALLVACFYARLSLGQSAKVTIEDTEITIPAPTGFYRYDGKNKLVDKLDAEIAGPKKRNLASFGSEADLADTLVGKYPALDRSFYAQAPLLRQFSRQQFLAIKDKIKSNITKDVDRKKVEALEEVKSSAVARGTGKPFEVKLGELLWLGIFDESEESVSYAALSKIQAASSTGAPVERVVVSSYSDVLISGRMISLHCSCQYRAKQDIDWVRDSIKMWKDALLKANLPKAPGAGQTDKVLAGEDTIVVPAPEGFFRYDGKSKSLDNFQQASFGPTNRLLASFCSETDLHGSLLDKPPSGPRQFHVFVTRSLESIRQSPEQFKDLRGFFRKELDQSIDRVKVNELEAKASKIAAKELKEIVAIKVGEKINLGVFDETAESICFSMLVKMAGAAEGKDQMEIVTISAASFMLVKGHTINLNCISEYREKADIEWARQNVKKWRDAILSANKQ